MQDQPLDAFRQILIWPLSLSEEWREANADKDARKLAADALKASNGIWTEVEHNNLDVDPPDEFETFKTKAYRYGEYVYFHQFVQSFLYRGAATERAIRVFARTGINWLRIGSGHESGADAGAVFLCVERINLYLFETGSAALVVELVAPDVERRPPWLPSPHSQLKLRQAMTLSDHLRRTFPPYFKFVSPPERTDNPAEASESAKIPVPGLMEEDVQWLDGRGEEVIVRANKWETIATDVANHKQNHTPVSNDWLELIRPLQIDGYQSESANAQPVWRHVVDDRMPTMHFIKVRWPEAIPEGDMMRLCFCDGTGQMPFPASESFLRKDWHLHTYDRFWGSGYSTRFLCSGYNFTIVCKTGDLIAEPLEQHFRRHYFRIGLILQFQYAVLLAFSSRVSRAVEIYQEKKDRTAFRHAVRSLREDLLNFTHRFWFTGVSNQLQAREIYEWWRGRLGVQTIYDEVMEEAERAYEFQLAEEQREQTRQQEKQTRAASLLNMFLAATVPPALMIGILAMNLVTGDGGGADWSKPGQWAAGLAGFAVATTVSARLLRWIGRQSEGEPALGKNGDFRSSAARAQTRESATANKFAKTLYWLSGVMLFVAVGAGGAALWPPQDTSSTQSPAVSGQTQAPAAAPVASVPLLPPASPAAPKASP